MLAEIPLSSLFEWSPTRYYGVDVGVSDGTVGVSDGTGDGVGSGCG